MQTNLLKTWSIFLERKATARKFLGAAVWGRFMKSDQQASFEPITTPFLKQTSLSGMLIMKGQKKLPYL